MTGKSARKNLRPPIEDIDRAMANAQKILSENQKGGPEFFYQKADGEFSFERALGASKVKRLGWNAAKESVRKAIAQ